ncbi:Aste57867_10843 [Aphanomyces stellatus]|uniref:Aste57867_10843 protein n=1 Tax=Aphanomyces stellatus TaxID=120398 RepID=A0A485KRG0_9STRA|nr:hypothetical protein As57867_010803 [Aphanomyces stellatus]VFT87711.1 Aste57867_10843 [Aphanomyces stellatus]
MVTSTRRRIVALLGAGYLLFTLSCGVDYVTLLAPSLTNELYWPRFNISGFETFVIDAANLRLMDMSAQGNVDMLSSDVIMPKSYAKDDVQPQFAPTYSRQLLLTQLNTLPRAIRDLRNTTKSTVVYAHYCWVDFQRRWDIAHTAARSARCLQKYTANGANYLETLFRNTDWNAFSLQFQDSWPIAFGLALAATPEGAQWLAERPTSVMQLSVDDEVAYLHSLAITRYDLQWQNAYEANIIETLAVRNALGMSESVTLKALNAGNTPWTSVVLYWMFFNDLNFMQLLNMSLVRGAANFVESMGIDFALLYGFADGSGQYVQQSGVFSTQIGPFGSVDAIYVAVPPSFTTMYRSIERALYDYLWSSSTAFSSFASTAPLSLTPLPPNFALRGVTYFGGNLFCLNNAATSFPQSQFAYYDACTQSNEWTMAASNTALVLSSVATTLASTPTQICGYQTTSIQTCMPTLVQIHAIAHRLLTNDMAVQVKQATMDAPPAVFVQYAQNATQDWVLLQQPLLLENDSAWSFYGWLAFYEWTAGTREVVRVEGDADTITLISDASSMLVSLSSSANVGPSSDSRILYSFVVYMSVTLIGVGLGVCVLAARSMLVDGRNFFFFNRVAGSVWIGRPLLFVRGVTAIILLSSTQELLVDQCGYARLISTPRSLWANWIVAGESTWVAYVITDALILFMGPLSHYMTPLTSLIAWVATLALDSRAPVTLSVTIDRQCTVVNTDKLLQCQSGVLQAGASTRVAILLAIQIACGVLPVLIRTTRRGHVRLPSSLLFHGTSDVFLFHQAALAADEILDDAACVMAGLIPLSFKGVQYTFDIKLWIVVQTSSSHRVEPSTPRNQVVPFADVVETRPPNEMWMRLAALLGLAYVFMTGAGSVSYIAVSSVNLANDFYWATFNLTGHHVALSNWITEQMMLNRSVSNGRLDASQWSTMEYNYSNTQSTGKVAPFMAPRMQFENAHTIVAVIQGLRHTDACAIPWVFTQYCWLDFQHQWPTANSAKRQTRCQHEVANGAVYVEAVLRNVDWPMWRSCWGLGFDIAFGNTLSSSENGKLWLQALESPRLEVTAEVAYWHNVGIAEYTVQWQNYKTTGLVNTYAIENAFGIQYPMTLSRTKGEYSFATETSNKMYWGWARDLWTVTDNTTRLGGMSLIRGSSNYAFANTSMLDVLVENGTLSLPFCNAFQLVQTTIGPMGSIDMKNIPCPAPVYEFVASSLDMLRQVTFMNATAASVFNTIALPATNHFETIPTKWAERGLWFDAGGNILCPNFGVATLAAGLQAFTGRFVNCGQDFGAVLYSSSTVMVIAAAVSNVDSTTIPAICSHYSNPIACTESFLPQISAFLPFLNRDGRRHLASKASLAKSSILALTVSLMQYVQENRTTPLEMDTFAILDPSDPTFEFWSWLYVFSWVKGEREVVRFEGDAGAIHLLTEQVLSLPQDIQVHELPTTFAMYARAGVQYVTGLMLGVTILVLFYVVLSRGLVEGMNLFELNRVAGIVWVGRPLLLLRGVTALCLLSTATLELQLQHGVSYFNVPTLPWYKTCLGAGEAVWLVYILNDLLMVWTRQHTLYYASSSSTLVWVVAASLTLAYPVTHQATVQPQCAIDQMDFQLMCDSGLLVIGQVARLYWLLGVIGICNAIGLGAAWYFIQRLDQNYQHESLLLSAGAKYLFDSTHWVQDHTYYIDPASAVLNGLVSWRWGHLVYVLDIKLWRILKIMVGCDGKQYHHLARTVPLRN